MTEETYTKASYLREKIEYNRKLMSRIEAIHRKNKQDKELNDLLETLYNAIADIVTEFSRQFNDI
jgi:hypothetical protein